MTKVEINTDTPKLFLTDYASYNNGTQFEFGHWVDLTDFSDADEFFDYIQEHFEEADEKSPLDSPREEIMFTDYENFPSQFYSESMSKEEVQTIFDLVDWMNENSLENLENDGDNLLDAWNEYCSENNMDDYIHNFDDDFFETYLSSDPQEAFRLGCFSDIRWSDKYLIFNGYGNLESFDDPSNHIDETVLIDWIVDNL